MIHHKVLNPKLVVLNKLHRQFTVSTTAGSNVLTVTGTGTGASIGNLIVGNEVWNAQNTTASGSKQGSALTTLNPTVPWDVKVTATNAGANTITMSAAANATATGVTVYIGTRRDLVLVGDGITQLLQKRLVVLFSSKLDLLRHRLVMLLLVLLIGITVVETPLMDLTLGKLLLYLVILVQVIQIIEFSLVGQSVRL